MSAQYEKLLKCYEYYKSVTDFEPRVGLILGSGLGGYARNMQVVQEIPYGVSCVHGPGTRREIPAGIYRKRARGGHERQGALLRRIYHGGSGPSGPPDEEDGN